MGLPSRDAVPHIYAEYCRWTEDVHYGSIDGEAYAMAPSPCLNRTVAVPQTRQTQSAKPMSRSTSASLCVRSRPLRTRSRTSVAK